jgi:hypothetical protein
MLICGGMLRTGKQRVRGYEGEKVGEAEGGIQAAD